MLADAPALLVALEQSAFAAGIRQSIWAYPTANVGHIVALCLFAGSVTVMDMALLGGLKSAARASVVRVSRLASVLALVLMAATGFVLFAAEASHVAMNTVFQIKAVLIAAGILNALLAWRPMRRALATSPPAEPLPWRLRASALFSLLVWLSVAACGRLIAYF